MYKKIEKKKSQKTPLNFDYYIRKGGA